MRATRKMIFFFRAPGEILFHTEMAGYAARGAVLGQLEMFCIERKYFFGDPVPKRTMVVPIGFLVAALRGEEEGKWF
jgi:hypothetical protein